MAQNLEELKRETRSSIEVTRNSKSDYQWVIKTYYEDGKEGEALGTIRRIDGMLRYDFLPVDQKEIDAAIDAIDGGEAHAARLKAAGR